MQKIHTTIDKMESTARCLAKSLGGKMISSKGTDRSGNPSIAIVDQSSKSAAWDDKLALIIGHRGVDCPDGDCDGMA